MIASELIVELQRAIKQHGDFPVVVEDGLDPSDYMEARRVELEHGRFFSEASGFFECHDNVPHLRIS